LHCQLESLSIEFVFLLQNNKIIGNPMGKQALKCIETGQNMEKVTGGAQSYDATS